MPPARVRWGALRGVRPRGRRLPALPAGDVNGGSERLGARCGRSTEAVAASRAFACWPRR